jgi:type II secretion system protein E
MVNEHQGLIGQILIREGLITQEQLDRALDKQRNKELIGKILIKEGKITQEQLDNALEEQTKTHQKIGRILVNLGYIEEEDVLSALATQLALPFVKISDVKISPEAIKKVPVKFASRYKIFPLKIEKNTLTVAVTDPLDIRTLDDLRFLTDMEPIAVISTEKDIINAIRQYYGIGAETIDEMVAADQEQETSEELTVDTADKDLEKLAEDPAIIKFVNQIILEAYQMRATDIHIEPFKDELRIRYRIDGVLHETTTPPAMHAFQQSIISRIKIMADMNIAEHRLPQDGRIKINVGQEEIDLRVSTIPTFYGETIDLRILPHSQMMLSLEQLGLPKSYLSKMEALIHLSHGIVLVTGPTGHGKTTTLYACLSKINSPDKKIITIEDPIEYRLRGVNQMQVRPKINLLFSTGLRAILRQDPDIIMVGEIRDLETAEIAIRASLTGHLVFSTLHTNDACGAITRLIDMGIEPFLVSSSVEGVLAQRLVRLLCNKCKREYKPDTQTLTKMGLESLIGATIYEPGDGCEECRFTGYHGRTGIYELFITNNEDIKQLIMDRAPAGVINKKARSLGMITLKEDGCLKIKEGLTSIEEVLRVAQADILTLE